MLSLHLLPFYILCYDNASCNYISCSNKITMVLRKISETFRILPKTSEAFRKLRKEKKITH